MMISRWWIGKDVQGSGADAVWVGLLYLHLPGTCILTSALIFMWAIMTLTLDDGDGGGGGGGDDDEMMCCWW
jgi:hypothetical protein